jgi:hypothetical protein
MIRVLDKNVPVKVELNVETKFYGRRRTASTPSRRSRTDRVGDRAARRALRLAPIATGATDNATGSGALMEVV